MEGSAATAAPNVAGAISTSSASRPTQAAQGATTSSDLRATGTLEGSAATTSATGPSASGPLLIGASVSQDPQPGNRPSVPVSGDPKITGEIQTPHMAATTIQQMLRLQEAMQQRHEQLQLHGVEGRSADGSRGDGADFSSSQPGINDGDSDDNSETDQDTHKVLDNEIIARSSDD